MHLDQEQYIKYAKKQCNLLRLIAVFVAGIFLVTVVCAVMIIPRANGAMETLGDVDIESLNDAIRDLKAIVEPLGRLFGR